MKLVICGDVSITEESSQFFETIDAKGAFNDIIDVHREADRVIVNLECATTESTNEIYKFGPCLKAPLNTAKTLKEAGVTDCSLSNNHIFDFGKEGLYDTIREIEAAGLNYTGIGENYEDSRRNLIIEHPDVKIAVIAVCEHEYSYAIDNRCGARPCDPFETMHDIREAKKTADKIIVILHGGKELCRYPSPRLIKECREMVRCGADIVLCQHSHIIGSCEEFEGGHILYGQGNFHFARSWKPESWNEGLIAQIDITKDGFKVNYLPLVAENGAISLAKGERKEKILSDMAKRNEEIVNGKWKDGWADFCLSDEGHPDWYRGVLERLDLNDPHTIENFAHYLDCEAHLDVWKHTYQTANMTNEIDK